MFAKLNFANIYVIIMAREIKTYNIVYYKHTEANIYVLYIITFCKDKNSIHVY